MTSEQHSRIYQQSADGGRLVTGRRWTAKAVADLFLVVNVLVAGGILGACHLALLSLDLASVRIVAPFWLTIFSILLLKRRDALYLQQTSGAQFRDVWDWILASVLSTGCWFVATDSKWEQFWCALGITLSGAAALYIVEMAKRRVMNRLMKDRALGDRVALLGSDGEPGQIELAIQACSPGSKLVAIFDERSTRSSEVFGGIKIQRDLDDLLNIARTGAIDSVIVNLPWSAEKRIIEMKERLESVNVNVILAPALIQMMGIKGNKHLTHSPYGLVIYKKPVTGFDWFAKQAQDRIISLLALLVLSPILVIVAIAIKIDSPGPVLFRQQRLGLNNLPFEMLKFRSMYEAQEDKNANVLAVRGDARISRVGAFIRRTSLDELPQLFNVLCGDMSLVGPRPHAFGAKAEKRLYEDVVRRYPARHRVMPGITGLAQVRGHRGNTERESDIVKRVESDLEYIDRWSLTLDLTILLRTLATFLFHKNAY